MRKGFIFAGLLITFALSYLFYRSCKRDTSVISPMHRVAIPDSSWIYGSINLQQIKKDIAWSALLNGDFNKIFKTDTNSNTLLKIVRSPNTYSINAQDNIQYFSVCKDSTFYKGLLFSIENDLALKRSFKSDSFTVNQKKIYSFRSNEGIWLYDSINLLFVSGRSDSLAACRFFTVKDTLPTAPSDANVDTLEFASDQTILISGNINTLFLPSAVKSPLLDSALVSFNVMSNDDLLDINWTYKGFLAAVLNQSSITHQNNEAALFCAGNFNATGLQQLLNKIPDLQQSYLKEKETIAPFLTAVDKNNLTLEFNGWKKIKSSYYASVLNDEFETVLQKKDSSIVEPIFKISLEQKNKTAAQNFLSYLQKEGLVSKGKQPFAVIYGNFDSELSLNSTNTLTVHNKHTSEWARTPGPHPLDAALLVTVNPASLKGLADSQIKNADLFQAVEKYKQISSILLHVKKENNQLTGNIKIKFAGESHPLIELVKVLKNSGQ
ncbi:hypothetical protein [Cytophaga aurantiaca]|uniref:hypothetical protein n=1 Tax=Cytophaga aurantiaca TaxID=29530 RepID=UPI00037CC263|nr:hypothetical protein [Cytophaga aurantiaca]